jgi:hypothetical protein
MLIQGGKMFHRFYLGMVIVLGVILGSGPAQACDLCGCSINSRRSGAGNFATTPTASTLGRGRGSVGFLFEHQRFNTIPAGDAHTLHHQGHDIHGKNHEEYYSFSAGYGVLDDLDVYLTAPIVSKTSIEVHEHDALGQRGTAGGFGDLRLTGKYRFWDQGVDAALLLGVKAPTGETSDTTDAGGKFEPELQPGSGAWDVMVGVAASRSLGQHVSLANAFRYTARGEGAQESELGDVFHYGAGISFAVRPLGEHPNVSLMLELHNEWARRDSNREHDSVEDSGGTTILLSPGVSADLTPTLSAFFAMPVPIYQNLGGQHEELRYEVLTGLSWHW